jgi:hypothetical protein
MLTEELLLIWSERYITLRRVERNVTQTFMYAVRRVFEHLLYYRWVAAHCQILEGALSRRSAVSTSFRCQFCIFMYLLIDQNILPPRCKTFYRSTLNQRVTLRYIHSRNLVL